MKESNRIQVEEGHYDPSAYDELHRWKSYWYQIQAIGRSQPARLLEIGSGSGVISWYARERMGVEVVTFDFDNALSPDIVGDVRDLTQYFECDSFDCVCAFQVLEHIPFEDFERALQAMASISSRSVLISLPHWGYPIELRMQLVRRAWTFAMARKVSPPKRWSFDGEHHWEIGVEGCSLQTVRNVVNGPLEIKREYFCPDYSYHYFFECTVR